MSASTTRIILTDDHPLYRTGVKNGLSKKPDIEIIGEADHGRDLLEKLTYLSPDMIIMGITMPVMNGEETLPILKTKYPGIKVIILTMHNDLSMILRMLRLGANAYLTKESRTEVIYQTILALRTDWIYMNKLAVHAIASLKDPKPEKPGEIKFSEKEMQILKLLCSGMPGKEIAERVDLSPRTVDAIIDKMKKKTGAETIAALKSFYTN